MNHYTIASMLMGTFHGISTYKKKEVNYNLYLAYFGIATTIHTVADLAESKLYKNNVNRYNINRYTPFGSFVTQCLFRAIHLSVGHIVGITGIQALN